ncbi:MAG: hypothetical protein RL095_2851 [Verrucomicrobiota bacterium]|jgi:hypothetical protein
MIAELERLASLHQNGHIDDAEFKLAKEKLLQGSEGKDQLALRLELTEAQIKLSENDKNWPLIAKYHDGSVDDHNVVSEPSQFNEGLCMLLFCLFFFPPIFLPEMNKYDWQHWLLAGLWIVGFICISGMILIRLLTHKTRLQRFLAAQAEHNAEQSALRSRIAQLQQQLT